MKLIQGTRVYDAVSDRLRRTDTAIWDDDACCIKCGFDGAEWDWIYRELPSGGAPAGAAVPGGVAARWTSLTRLELLPKCPSASSPAIASNVCARWMRASCIRYVTSPPYFRAARLRARWTD